MLIDGAIPPGRMQEPASAFEDFILAVSQHTMTVFLDEPGEFALGRFVTDLESLSQPRYVAFRDQYPIICAAVSRAFCTVVTEACFYYLAVGVGSSENG